MVERSKVKYLYHPHDNIHETEPEKGNWTVFKLTPAGASYVDAMWARMRGAATTLPTRDFNDPLNIRGFDVLASLDGTDNLAEVQ